MEGSTAKGFGIGCVVSALSLVAVVFLFTMMCGMLMNGCV